MASKKRGAGTKRRRKGNGSGGSDGAKHAALERFRADADDQFLTTDQGVRVNDDQNSLKAGARGPSLLEDFILREKITHFDHERIPERVVHARGAAAHGYFQVYKSLSRLTRARFLQDEPRGTGGGGILLRRWESALLLLQQGHYGRSHGTGRLGHPARSH